MVCLSYNQFFKMHYFSDIEFLGYDGQNSHALFKSLMFGKQRGRKSSNRLYVFGAILPINSPYKEITTVRGKNILKTVGCNYGDSVNNIGTSFYLEGMHRY